MSGVWLEIYCACDSVARVANRHCHDVGFRDGVHVTRRLASSLELRFGRVDRCSTNLPKCEDARHAGSSFVPECPRALFFRTVSHDDIFKCDIAHCVLPKLG